MLGTILNLIIFSAASGQPGAGIEILKEEKIEGQLGNCAVSDSCDLKKFFLLVQSKKVELPKTDKRYASYLTDLRAVYETTEPASIKKYAIVQRIRGCQYYSEMVGGVERAYLGVGRDYFGAQRVFQHREWEIDNDLPVPIYSAARAKAGNIDNFYLVRWNKNPNSFDAETAKYLGLSEPPHGTVFTTDLPGMAALMENPYPGRPLTAKNTSLEFKSCLFKTSDLPDSTDPQGSNVPWERALSCLPWEHKFRYDFKTKAMLRESAMAPICDLK